MEIPAPIKGISKTAPLDKMPPLTSHDMLNMRGICSLERKVRLGQRPGFAKLFAQQIGGIAAPVVMVGSVTTVD